MPSAFVCTPYSRGPYKRLYLHAFDDHTKYVTVPGTTSCELLTVREATSVEVGLGITVVGNCDATAC
jgi:hypothetical protein